MRTPLPNPFLPNEDEAFTLDADAFLEAIAPGVVPHEDDHREEAPSVVGPEQPTYPEEFETYDIEELARLARVTRWHDRD